MKIKFIIITLTLPYLSLFSMDLQAPKKIKIEETSNICKLSETVHDEIIEFLDASDIKNLTKSCKAFNNSYGNPIAYSKFLDRVKNAGNTSLAIYLAAISGNLPFINKIMGYDKAIANKILGTVHNQLTPHEAAAANNQIDALKLLFQYPKKSVNKDLKLFQALIQAMNNQHLDCINYLLEQIRHNQNICGMITPNDSRSILHVAAATGNKIILSRIIAYVRGIDQLLPVIFGGDRDGNTPLHLAAKIKDVDIATIEYLQQNCNDHLNSFQRSALLEALVEKNFETFNILQFYPDRQLTLNNKLIDAVNLNLEPVTIKYLLDLGAEIDYSNFNRDVIWLAVELSNIDSLRILLKSGANVNGSFNGTHYLYSAVCTNNKNIVELLLKSGATASINKPTAQGNTPLLAACYNGNKEIAELLLNNKADINLKNIHGALPLLYAALNKNNNCNFLLCKKLLKVGANINDRDNANQSLLHCLAQSNATAAECNYFCSKFNNLCLLDNDGNTPLHIAAQYNHNFYKLLIEKYKQNSKIHPNKNGYTPFEIYAFLSYDSLGFNVLHRAIQNHTTNAALISNILHSKLIQKHINDTTKTPIKFTALHLAALYNSPEIAKLLIDKGADVNILDANNPSALGYALSLAHFEFAKILIDAGAVFPQFATQSAVKANRLEVLKFILLHNLDINEKDQDGKTALDLAIEKNNQEMIDLIKDHINKQKQ